ncbi:hypothetical protein BKA62DRAFT_702147 [Auriculariales sp. MPI-PUGE-AT-0066]|nr:hypothetical protein BKA62DRAFT_702147 [Auriculariales sp. MPI-PUGE-AT-0066]
MWRAERILLLARGNIHSGVKQKTNIVFKLREHVLSALVTNVDPPSAQTLRLVLRSHRSSVRCILCPLLWEKKRFFYPIGNSPAVSLTDQISSEEQADILLLGCGDVRSILFTVYTERLHLHKENNRSLDFTCCDYEPTVLARNLILFALLLNCDAPANLRLIWNIYYHFFLDVQTHTLLRDICVELHEATSRFGRLLRMGSSYLAQYLTTANMDGVRKVAFRRTYEQAIRTKFTEANDAKSRVDINPGGGGPLLHHLHASNAMYKLYVDYWATGTIFGAPSSGPAVACINPLFAHATQKEAFPAHYGSEPCQGYHLAEGLLDLSHNASPALVANRCANTALDQFARWCAVFCSATSTSQSNISIRFLLGHAANLSRALGPVPDLPVARFICQWSSGELTLDGPDYTNGATTPAPRRFNIIDTSNLGDHLGMTNVLILARPLLSDSKAATWYTETLLKPEIANDLSNASLYGLCADAPTLAILLGVAPRAYLQGVSSHSSLSEVALAQSERSERQTRERIAWVPTGPHRISIDATLLSILLYDIYCEMTLYEDMMGSIHASNTRKRRSYGIIMLDTREGFAYVLRQIQHRMSDADTWRAAMRHLFHRIETATDARGLLARNSYQDLCLHLHLLGVHDILPRYPAFMAKSPYSVNKDKTLFRDWPDVPAVVCVTLKVPRRKFAALEGLRAEEIGNPVFTGNLTSTLVQATNDFYSVHAVHGSFSRVENAAQTRVHMTFAKDGWQGTGDVVVMFQVPAWILMVDPQGMTARLSLRISPLVPGFVKAIRCLGPDLMIFSASVNDAAHVAVTRDAPHLQPPVPIFSQGAGQTRATPLIVSALGGSGSSAIARLRTRVNIPSELKDIWTERLSVTVYQTSACALTISTGTMNLLSIEGPIGRGTQTHTMDAITSNLADVMHRVVLDSLPKIDLSSGNHDHWLAQHIAHMFSDHEVSLMKDAVISSARVASCDDTLVDLKNMIRIVLSSAVQMLRSTPITPKSQALRLRTTAGPEEVPDSIIVLNALRVDLSGSTVILDGEYVDAALRVDDTHAGLEVSQTALVLDFAGLAPASLDMWNAYIKECRRRCASSTVSTRVAISPLFPAPYLEPVAHTPEWLLGVIHNSCRGRDTSGDPRTRGTPCARCGNDTALLQCAACKSTTYCGKTCQKEH